jgi:CxxC motif-containing protein (DUF1111 family)
VVLFGGFVYWWAFADGLPVWWGPSASAAEIAAGRELFEHEWTANDPLASGDGLGPVFNARSCAACHFQGGVGGGGEVFHNVTQFEVLPQPGKNEYLTGALHADGVTKTDRESFKLLRSMYPIVTFPASPPPPPGEHCGYSPRPKPPFDPIRTVNVQTTALFGIGWLDRISPKAITANAQKRGAKLAVAELTGNFDGVPVGRVPYTADGRVGKFGWKGKFATLEEFVAAACANELGLGTPSTPQAKPLHKPTAANVSPDLSKEQFHNLMAFVDTLPKPVEVATPTSKRGKEVFASVGCAACHVPDMGGVKGVYSDFLLYTLDDPSPSGGFADYGAEPPPENARPSTAPAPQEWKTPPLWGVADSAPYMHDGSATTLRDAIMRHHGDAKSVTVAYQKLPADDQAAVIAFLESLKAPPDATPSQVKKLTGTKKK